jgi:hypothetical protein
MLAGRAFLGFRMQRLVKPLALVQVQSALGGREIGTNEPNA